MLFCSMPHTSRIEILDTWTMKGFSLLRYQVTAQDAEDIGSIAICAILCWKRVLESNS